MKSSPTDRPSRPKVLLTGANGNIGSRSISILEQSMDLRLTDLSPHSDDPRYVPGDLMDFRAVLGLLEGMDAVIHLAMADANSFGSKNPETPNMVDELLMRVNMGSTYNILEGARQRGVGRMVYASSLTVHLGNRHRESYDSSTTLDPSNLYSCTKLFGEHLARVYWREHGLSTIGLRIGQPFPIRNPTYDDLWRTNKRARSNFVQISDVARALACGVHTEEPFGMFNVVSASDNQRFDLNETRRIGYVPRAYLDDTGLRFFEDGNFPPPTGPVVTHNPGEAS